MSKGVWKRHSVLDGVVLRGIDRVKGWQSTRAVLLRCLEEGVRVSYPTVLKRLERLRADGVLERLSVAKGKTVRYWRRVC